MLTHLQSADREHENIYTSGPDRGVDRVLVEAVDKGVGRRNARRKYLLGEDKPCQTAHLRCDKEHV